MAMSLTTATALRSFKRSAFFCWWPPGKRSNGTRMVAFLRAAISAIVVAPARETTTSAAPMSSFMVVLNSHMRKFDSREAFSQFSYFLRPIMSS